MTDPTLSSILVRRDTGGAVEDLTTLDSVAGLNGNGAAVRFVNNSAVEGLQFVLGRLTTRRVDAGSVQMDLAVARDPTLSAGDDTPPLLSLASGAGGLSLATATGCTFTAGGTLNVSGAATLAGTLSVTGAATLNGGLSVSGNISVTGTVDGRDISTDGANFDKHLASTANPHNTTAAQVGALVSLAGVRNAGGDIALVASGALTVTPDDANNRITIGENHSARTDNPHGTTAAQVGALPSAGGTIGGNLVVNGNVGIGASSPRVKLELAGDLLLSGNNSITTRRGLVHLGTTDGSQATSGEVVGALGFWGFGVQHAQISFRAGSGFELVDRSPDGPSLGHKRDSHNYADLKMRGLTLTGDLLLSGNNSITTRRGLVHMGTTDGSQATSGEVVGALGFWGFGVQHAQISFRAGSGFELVDVSADGPHLAIGRDSRPYADLKVRTLQQASSREWKENLSDLTAQEALAALDSLAPVKFSYRDDETHRLQPGFVAEDVPELVAVDGGKHLNALNIVAVLTKVVQEQQQTIATLTERVTHMESRKL